MILNFEQEGDNYELTAEVYFVGRGKVDPFGINHVRFTEKLIKELVAKRLSDAGDNFINVVNTEVLGAGRAVMKNAKPLCKENLSLNDKLVDVDKHEPIRHLDKVDPY